MSRRGRWTASVLLGLVAVVLAGGVLVYERPMSLAEQATRFHLWRAGVKSDDLEIDGRRIHYLEGMPAGGGTGRPLVLIHGLGGKAEDWAALLPGLVKAGFHVYAPDLLGYGRSEHPDVSYSIAMQQQMVKHFMLAKQVPRADVVGWSMGGWIAMKLALEEREMVDRLVVYDAAGVYFAGYTELLPLFDVRDAAGARRLVAKLTPKAPELPEFVWRDMGRKIHRNFWVLDRSLTAMQSGRDLLDFRLHQIGQPTLVVWGKQDDLIPLSVGETIHKGIGGSAIVVLDGCGHLLPVECSDVALQQTLNFLKAEPAPQGGERELKGRP